MKRGGSCDAGRMIKRKGNGKWERAQACGGLGTLTAGCTRSTLLHHFDKMNLAIEVAINQLGEG